MTGGPSSASDHIISMRYRNSLIIPLHRMTSVKTDHIIFSCHKIKTRRSRFFKINDVLFCIDDLRTSGDHIVFWRYPIEKCHLNSGPPIFQHHFQCLCFFLSSIHCRGPDSPYFSRQDPISPVTQVTGSSPILSPYDQRCASVISCSPCWKFLREHIQE